ncbi:MAG: hypothetical protein GY809_12385 [Planctomycetes bacterium]|nr:hypothetical protein [Planctomycetota bacterium]
MKINRPLAVLVIPRLMTLCCQVQARPISMTLASGIVVGRNPTSVQEKNSQSSLGRPTIASMRCQQLAMTMVNGGPQQMLSDACVRYDRTPGGWVPRLTR